jgi:NAD(P)-dependent dehydrogenase (short-subunit alcohol dehydrogenase family)
MSEDRKLTGKVAIVFGGSRGIGAAAARRLASPISRRRLQRVVFARSRRYRHRPNPSIPCARPQ